LDGNGNRGSGVATGTVKWFNKDKGYGFIAPDEGGDDVFVHVSAVKAAGLTAIAEDERLSFEVEAGPKGRTVAASLRKL
jgi:CspA family cold shock protein